MFGAGKSSFADALVEALQPRTAIVVREDEYQHDLRGLPNFDPNKYDFDHYSARDHDLLFANLIALKSGEGVREPIYSFVKHGRTGRTRWRAPAEVVVLEGIHVLTDPRLRALSDLTIYLDVPADIRLARRVLRDVRRRGRKLEGVIEQYFATVRPAYDNHIKNAAAVADIVLRSASECLHPPLEQIRDWTSVVGGEIVKRGLLSIDSKGDSEALT